MRCVIFVILFTVVHLPFTCALGTSIADIIIRTDIPQHPDRLMAVDIDAGGEMHQLVVVNNVAAVDPEPSSPSPTNTTSNDFAKEMHQLSSSDGTGLGIQELHNATNSTANFLADEMHQLAVSDEKSVEVTSSKTDVIHEDTYDSSEGRRYPTEPTTTAASEQAKPGLDEISITSSSTTLGTSSQPSTTSTRDSFWDARVVKGNAVKVHVSTPKPGAHERPSTLGSSTDIKSSESKIGSEEETEGVLIIVLPIVILAAVGAATFVCWWHLYYSKAHDESEEATAEQW